MKKIFALIILGLLVFALIGCNAPTPPGSCWADTELLEYLVTDNGEDIGVLTVVTKRKLEDEDKILNEKTYNNATTKIVANYEYNDNILRLECLLDDFSPLAVYKKVNTTDKSYELNSYYEGKYYHYSLIQDEEEYIGRLKIKAPFMDNDLLYTYIRTHHLANLNQTLSIPLPLSHDIDKLNVRAIGTEKLEVPFPDKSETVSCHKVAISRTSSPIGSVIYVYFTPDKSEYTISGSLSSIYDSSKIPVKIVENNIVYKLSQITVL